LDELDHSIHKKFGVKYYGRYVDDMVFVHPDKEFLKLIIPKVRYFLKQELGLTLHPKKVYLQNFKKGVYFLGVFIKPYRIYIGKKTKQKFNAKLISWNRNVKTKNNLSDEQSNGFVSCVNSYLGIMKHYDTYQLRKKIVKEKFATLWWNYFYLASDVSKIIKKLK